MKKILNTLFLILIVSALKAQQMPHYSQYLLNDYVINPAVAGSRGMFEARTNHRNQWVGITDAPRTFILSVNGPTESGKVGLGGSVFNDIVGPTRRTGFNFSYAYHFNLTSKVKMSLALSAGLLQFAIDGSRIRLRDPGDELFATSIQSTLVPDFGFGFYIYDENFFVGGSAPQLTQNKLKFFDNINGEAKLEDHYFISAGYKFKINDDFAVQPYFLAKYVSPVPLQADISARVIYADRIWLGATFRTQDAFSALLGFKPTDNLVIGYSYDYTISGLRRYSTGTHEIMLGINFIKNDKSKSNPIID